MRRAELGRGGERRQRVVWASPHKARLTEPRLNCTVNLHVADWIFALHPGRDFLGCVLQLQLMAPHGRVGFIGAGLFACMCLLCDEGTGHCAETAAPGGGDVSPAESALAPSFHFQEQQDLIRHAIEQAQREADAAARRNAEILTERLAQIQQSLEAQHLGELEAVQNSNRTAMLVAGALAAAGLLGLFCLAFFLMHATHRLTEAALAAPFAHTLDAGHGRHALTVGDPHLAVSNPAELVGARFLGAIEQLEKRLHELEHSTPHAPVADASTYPDGRPQSETRGAPTPGPSQEGNLPTPGPSQEGNASGALAGERRSPGPTEDRVIASEQAQINHGPALESGAPTEPGSQLGLLLMRGQSLLILDQAADALACFDEVIAREPRNTEALVKRGIALERLGRADEALDSYDHAIAVDGSLTAAYLHKGGVFNRLERYEEALKCYEKALQIEQKTLAP